MTQREIPKNCTLWPGFACTTIKKSLIEKKKYSIMIVGVNKGNFVGENATVYATTKEEASSPPLDLREVATTAHGVNLTWTHPWLPRGYLQSFTVEAVPDQSRLRNKDLYNWTVMEEYPLKEKKNQSYSFKLSSLLPSTTYIVKVRAKSSITGNDAAIIVSTPETQPQFNQNVSMIEVSNETVIIKLPPAPRYLTDDSASLVVVTLLKGIMPHSKDRTEFNDTVVRNKVLKEIAVHEGVFSWIAAEIQLNSTPEEFVLGLPKQPSSFKLSTKFCNQYENRPLAPVCRYQVSVVAMNWQPSGVLLSTVFLAQSVETKGTPLPLPPSNNLGLLSLLLLLIIPLLIYVIYIRFCKRKVPSILNDQDDATQRHSETGCVFTELVSINQDNISKQRCDDIEYDGYLQPVSLAKHQHPEPRPLAPTESNPTPVLVKDLSYRVPLDRLEKYVRTGLVSGKLHEQHDSILQAAGITCDFGQLPQNENEKECFYDDVNIYSNVPENEDVNIYSNLPDIEYDKVYENHPAHTPVGLHLKKSTTDKSSQGIEIHYIEGYKAPRFYAVVQCSRQNFMEEFWNMVWREQAQVICDLEDITETGKTEFKPELEKEGNHGMVMIHITTEESYADYTFRKLQVTYKGKKRTVQHLHFTSWPDHGVPLYTQSMAAYLKKLLAAPKGSGPILIHCSTGLGRVATVILADINLRMAAADDVVDVSLCQWELHQQMRYLVVNVDQYKLVHLALLECLVEESNSVPCVRDLRACVQLMKDQAVLDHQFLRLTQYKVLKMVPTTITRQTEVVPHKNRDQNIVPSIVSQVYLTPTTPGNRTSMYINAIYVDSVTVKNQFIATQFPLAETVGDFWRLVVEKEISLIVILNDMDFTDETVVKFRPTNNRPLQPLPFVEVKLTNVSKSDDWTLHLMQLNVTRPKASSKVKSIQLLQYKGWPSSRRLPESCDSLLKLWWETEHLSKGKGPILVTCLDGAKACGVFLALASVMERVKLEQNCNVYQVVRNMRQIREQFVDTQDQFEFLYEAVVAHVEGLLNKK